MEPFDLDKEYQLWVDFEQMREDAEEEEDEQDRLEAEKKRQVELVSAQVKRTRKPRAAETLKRRKKQMRDPLRSGWWDMWNVHSDDYKHEGKRTTFV